MSDEATTIVPAALEVALDIRDTLCKIAEALEMQLAGDREASEALGTITGFLGKGGLDD